MKRKQDEEEFSPRVPQAVRGGIRAQVRRSQKSRKPWAQQFLDYMESLNMGARLGRGRSYAMTGQVYNLDIAPGVIKAKVQGAEEKPYTCTLKCEKVSAKEKGKIVEHLRQRPMLLAQLQVRNLPPSLELIFRAAGYPLLPNDTYPWVPSCSCQDDSDNCKHVAAVMFILSEAFEHDPMLLLKFRGITDEDLFGVEEEEPVKKPSRRKATPQKVEQEIPFWGDDGSSPFDYGPQPEREVGGAPLVHRLGTIPFWRGEERFLETMEHCGERAAEQGWKTWACEAPTRVFDSSEGTPIKEGWTRTRR